MCGTDFAYSTMQCVVLSYSMHYANRITSTEFRMIPPGRRLLAGRKAAEGQVCYALCLRYLPTRATLRLVLTSRMPVLKLCCYVPTVRYPLLILRLSYTRSMQRPVLSQRMQLSAYAHTTEEGEEGEEEGEGDSEEEGGQSQGGWQGGARSGSLKAEEVSDRSLEADMALLCGWMQQLISVRGPGMLWHWWEWWKLLVSDVGLLGLRWHWFAARLGVITRRLMSFWLGMRWGDGHHHWRPSESHQPVPSHPGI
eukprot:2932298-Rhodomonas_salina.1